MTPEDRIQTHLRFIYSEKSAAWIWERLSQKLTDFEAKHPDRHASVPQLDQTDAILITYGDQLCSDDESPLSSLHRFATTHLSGAISGIHILPFYPYSSDDGFSVIDYRRVDPELGTWMDIRNLSENFRLMFDAVINHISRHSTWFQGFINGDRRYINYFIRVDPNTDLSQVVRPRALPLLTEVQTKQGVEHVWTTFSDDQIDLNYAEPQVILEILDLLLFYVSQGAEIIRLDAIAYLWKEIGTSSIHLPETHHVVKLMRAVLDAVAPDVILITETNVPHEENISYFGKPLTENGGATKHGDEAQMVYQFPLAPLVLHTFRTGDSSVLANWAKRLETPFKGATFFNFIASHDGIGVRPAEGLLESDEVIALVDQTLAHGGRVSYKTNSDGTQSPYELNITLYDLLNDPNQPDNSLDVKRFLASQAIMISLRGVPGIYIHSFFGSRNCHACFEKTGRARSINREKFSLESVESILDDPDSHQMRVFNGYTKLLEVRRNQAAFHPSAPQHIVDLGPTVFAIKRTSLAGDRIVICITSVIDLPQNLHLNVKDYDLPPTDSWEELIQGQKLSPQAGYLDVKLPPYETYWLLHKTD